MKTYTVDDVVNELRPYGKQSSIHAVELLKNSFKNGCKRPTVTFDTDNGILVIEWSGKSWFVSVGVYDTDEGTYSYHAVLNGNDYYDDDVSISVPIPEKLSNYLK